jgi:hypothetical protein
MKRLLQKLVLGIFLFVLPPCITYAQKIYSFNVWEFIFSYSNLEYTNAFIAEYPDAEIAGSNVRFTLFFHFEHDWHIDFTNNIGLITGFGIRNIGISSDESLPLTTAGDDYEEYKLIRRTYTTGIPIALKLGSFKDHLYFYGGGEYELAMHFKEKYWSGSYDRSGAKTKYNEWFGSQTPLLLPSVFAGVQLPGGFNLKFRYYLNNFLNPEYEKESTSDVFNLSDLTRYKTTQLYYISLSWQFSSEYLKKKDWKKDTEIVYNTY